MNTTTRSGLSNLAHTLGAWLGVLVAAQAPIVAYITGLPVNVKVANLAVGGFTLFCTLYKARGDALAQSNRDAATIAAGGAATPAAAPAVPPPAAGA